MTQWLFLRNGVQGGPASDEQIKSMAAQGQLAPGGFSSGGQGMLPMATGGERERIVPPGACGSAAAELWNTGGLCVRSAA